MISEREFASGFGTFWQGLLPLGDAYLRALNASLEAFADPLEWSLDSSRSALVSELAFEYFGRLADRRQTRVQALTTIDFEESRAAAAAFLARFEGFNRDAVSEQKLSDMAIELTRRLLFLFDADVRVGRVIVRPEFKGCGALRSCTGDLLVGETLFEIKSVGREFRQADLRQVLTYAALAFAGSGGPIRIIGLVNPRRGTCYRASLSEIADRAAGTSREELMASIVDFAVDSRVY